MSGKKKIAYPIELPFTIQEPILLNNANRQVSTT